MFVWTTLLVTPLIMSTGMIGMTDYLGYFFGMSGTESHSTASLELMRQLRAELPPQSLAAARPRRISSIRPKPSTSSADISRCARRRAGRSKARRTAKRPKSDPSISVSSQCRVRTTAAPGRQL